MGNLKVVSNKDQKIVLNNVKNKNVENTDNTQKTLKISKIE